MTYEEKNSKKLTIDSIKDYVNMTRQISEKLHKILIIKKQKEFFDDLDFEILDLKFCNKNKIVYITIFVDKFNNGYDFDFKEIQIPYKYLEIEDELLENLIDLKEEKDNDEDEYEKYLKLKEKYEKETEKCVICGCPTDEYKITHIDLRNHYVEGVGQLCKRCYLEYVVN